MMLKQDKGSHTESETEKDIPTQSDKFNRGCGDFWSLGKRCSRAKAHPYSAWGLKSCMHPIPFPEFYLGIPLAYINFV